MVYKNVKLNSPSAITTVSSTHYAETGVQKYFTYMALSHIICSVSKGMMLGIIIFLGSITLNFRLYGFDIQNSKGLKVGNYYPHMKHNLLYVFSKYYFLTFLSL